MKSRIPHQIAKKFIPEVDLYAHIYLCIIALYIILSKKFDNLYDSMEFEPIGFSFCLVSGIECSIPLQYISR